MKKVLVQAFLLPFVLLAACADPVVVAPLDELSPQAVVPGESTIRDSDGVILVDGEPFFPIGYYSKWNYNHAERMYEIQKLGAAGFNAYNGEANNTTFDDYGLFLDEAQQQGIKVLTKYFAYQPESDEEDLLLVNRFKTHPAVLGWWHVDDFNNHDPVDVQTKYNHVKAADPNHIVYASGYYPGDEQPVAVGNYVDKMDVVGMQSYPIPQGCCSWHIPAPAPAPHLSSTFWYMKWTIDRASPSNRSVIANLQTFNWYWNPVSRWPAAKEVDNMTYQAVVAGVKGILYYTFEDCEASANPCSTVDQTHPDVWEATINAASELKTLAPVLLNGQRTTTISEDKSVYSAYWEYKDHVYVIAVNTADTAKSVSLALPSGTVGPAKPLFADRPTGMTFTNGTLSGSLSGLDTHIYVLNAVKPTWTETVTDGTATFTIDTVGKQLRFASGDFNTGILEDTAMRITRGVIRGDLRTNEVRIRYVVHKRGNAMANVRVWDFASGKQYRLKARPTR